MMRTTARVAVWILAALGLAALATGAFIVSYGAIRAVWVSLGAGSADAADIVPLLIDGFIVLVSLVGVANALSGRPVRYPMLLVGVASAISVALNIAHADRTWGASLLAAVPPLVLLAATELFVRELRHVLTRRATQQPAPDPAPASTRQRLALLDPDDPDATAELLPATGAAQVIVNNTLSAVSAAGADASADASPTAALSADPPLAAAAPASTASAQAAATSTRALVTAAWQQREVDGGQRISAVALARELTAQRGQRVPEGTVRAELTRLRAHHGRS